MTAKLRPSEALAKHRDEVLAIIAKYPVSNPRVFGSVARGEDTVESDIDIMVDKSETLSLFDLAGLEIEIGKILDCDVDVLTLGFIAPDMRPTVEREARAL
jgi:uncharacterized protein